MGVRVDMKRDSAACQALSSLTLPFLMLAEGGASIADTVRAAWGSLSHKSRFDRERRVPGSKNHVGFRFVAIAQTKVPLASQMGAAHYFDIKQTTFWPP